MLKTTTIQISVRHMRFMEEWIYEGQVNTIEDLVLLSKTLGSKARYKKATDKNWYTLKTMTKRLFGNRNYEQVPYFNVVKVNDLNKELEEL